VRAGGGGLSNRAGARKEPGGGKKEESEDGRDINRGGGKALLASKNLPITGTNERICHEWDSTEGGGKRGGIKSFEKVQQVLPPKKWTTRRPRRVEKRNKKPRSKDRPKNYRRELGQLKILQGLDSTRGKVEEVEGQPLNGGRAGRGNSRIKSAR